MVKLLLGNRADVNAVGRFTARREGLVSRWSGFSRKEEQTGMYCGARWPPRGGGLRKWWGEWSQRWWLWGLYHVCCRYFAPVVL